MYINRQRLTLLCATTIYDLIELVISIGSVRKIIKYAVSTIDQNTNCI